jgi:hypothetical protein
MSRRMNNQILNKIDTRGCLALPLHLPEGTILGNTAHGAEVIKLAAGNGKKLCSTLPMTLVDVCDLTVPCSAYEGFPYLKQYIEDKKGNCISGHLLCVISDSDLAGACKEFESVKGYGTSCSCL